MSDPDRIAHGDEPVAVLDRDRFVKVCGLFSSAHDGERAAAAARADRMLRAAGLRWPDVIKPLLPPPDADLQSQIDFCAGCPEVLTEWERRFIDSLANRKRTRLSNKQMAVLARLVEKCNSVRTGGRDA